MEGRCSPIHWCPCCRPTGVALPPKSARKPRLRIDPPVGPRRDNARNPRFHRKLSCELQHDRSSNLDSTPSSTSCDRLPRSPRFLALQIVDSRRARQGRRVITLPPSTSFPLRDRYFDPPIPHETSYLGSRRSVVGRGRRRNVARSGVRFRGSRPPHPDVPTDHRNHTIRIPCYSISLPLFRTHARAAVNRAGLRTAATTAVALAVGWRFA